MAATEHAEVGVLEVVVVLEPVAHQPVEPDVSEPDQAESHNKRPVLPPPITDDQSRYRCGVGEVVAKGTDLGTTQVAGHGQVGEQKDHGHQPPMLSCGPIGDQGTDKEGCGLEA